MNEDWDGEELVDIEDPGLPDALREHAMRFRNPGKVVIVVGDGEYVLYAADGELLDLCFNRLTPCSIPCTISSSIWPCN